MKLKPRFECWLLQFVPIKAFVLYPFIFFEKSIFHYKYNDPECLKHEMIHVEQIKRMGVFKFYFNYLILWKWKELEHEAYARQYEPLTKEESEVYYGQFK